MSEAVRVREGGVARAKFARGRRTLRLSARVLRARVWTARSRQASGSRAGDEGEWGWKGRMEGAAGRELCPGERTVVVKMMCADVGLQPETLAFHSSELLH